MTKKQALIDILLALVLTLFGALLAGAFAALGAGPPPQLMILSIQGLVILIGLHLLLRMRGQTWRDLALPPFKPQDLWLALKAFVLMFVINMAFMMLLYGVAPALVETHQQRLSDVAGMLNHGAPFMAVGVAMLFVGFYEELLARGFLLNRCQHLIGGTWGPVIVSSILFGLGHFYQGMLGVLQTTLLGIVFASLVLRWKTLWPVILAHAVLNTVSLGLMRFMS